MKILLNCFQNNLFSQQILEKHFFFSKFGQIYHLSWSVPNILVNVFGQSFGFLLFTFAFNGKTHFKNPKNKMSLENKIQTLIKFKSFNFLIC